MARVFEEKALFPRPVNLKNGRRLPIQQPYQIKPAKHGPQHVADNIRPNKAHQPEIRQGDGPIGDDKLHGAGGNQVGRRAFLFA